MRQTPRVIGSTLMILGTSIGAGMLALPVATAQYTPTTIMGALFICWLLSTIGAYAVMELSLSMAPGSNLISMSKQAFGRSGEIISWLLYLLLMYSLTSAYLSGTGEIISGLLALMGIHLEQLVATLLSVALFFYILHKGVMTIDWLNRLLMTTKALTYFAIVLAVTPHIHLNQLAVIPTAHLAYSGMLTVILTSFGYSVIVPSMCDYLERNRRHIMTSVIIGSFIPLVIYALWIFVIQALIPKTGANGLIAIYQSNNTNGALLTALSQVMTHEWLPLAFKTFMTVGILTSFLGVSLSLSDFLADGLNLSKQGASAWLIYSLTLLPPLGMILWAPNLFMSALEHAGIICFFLLIVWPIAIYLKERQKTTKISY